jgi:hypothetical protein
MTEQEARALRARIEQGKVNMAKKTKPKPKPMPKGKGKGC